MVVAAFVLVTFAAVSAAFHAIQRAMAETAAAAGVQIAAGGSATDPRQPSLGSPEAFNATRGLLRSVAFGTNIAQGPASAQCPDLQGTLTVCTYADGALVAETIRGHPSFPVPWITQFLPWGIDVTVEMHQVSYQP